MRIFFQTTLAVTGCCSLGLTAAGLERGGAGARSMSLGGADAAFAGDPLSAMGQNPAGLIGFKAPEISVGLLGGLARGSYEKESISRGSLDDSFRGLPEAGFVLPVNERLALGLSFIPDSLLLADWEYNDTPGGLGGGVSYGLQRHRSELILVRSALGAALRLHETWSIGASAGLLYNENRLRAPYIFQDLEPLTAAAANGAKTLLDLETSGFGWNVQVGMIYAPLTSVRFGVTYRTKAEVSTDGSATGDPYAQFGAQPGPLSFHYDANVRNTFPQEVSAGASWNVSSKWRLAAQLEWLGWSDAFDTLPVRLENGDNPAVNNVLGANVQDNIPLDWKDRFVFRSGVEYALTETLYLRGGYAYGKSPVPAETLTPLTAIIMEHTVSAGAGYGGSKWGIDVGWQYDLPVSRHVKASGLRSGEYSNGTTEVRIHRVAVTGRYRF